MTEFILVRQFNPKPARLMIPGQTTSFVCNGRCTLFLSKLRSIFGLAGITAPQCHSGMRLGDERFAFAAIMRA
jgi:hypothetical protein